MSLPEQLRGDGPCQGCGTEDNIIWWCDNPIWNKVLGGEDATDDPGGILCIPCFVVRADQAGLTPTGWKLVPDFWPWVPA